MSLPVIAFVFLCVGIKWARDFFVLFSIHRAYCPSTSNAKYGWEKDKFGTIFLQTKHKIRRPNERNNNSADFCPFAWRISH